MTRSRLPFVLFIAAAVFFAACAGLQFAVSNVALGVVFTALAAVNVVLVVLIKSGRLPG